MPRRRQQGVLLFGDFSAIGTHASIHNVYIYIYISTHIYIYVNIHIYIYICICI